MFHVHALEAYLHQYPVDNINRKVGGVYWRQDARPRPDKSSLLVSAIPGPAKLPSCRETRSLHRPYASCVHYPWMRERRVYSWALRVHAEDTMRH